jgi:hypothetical protein
VKRKIRTYKFLRRYFYLLKRIFHNWKQFGSIEYDLTEYLTLPDKKLIYVVISKSACTSIKNTIGKDYGIESLKKSGLDIHKDPRWRRLFGNINREIKEQYDFFTFVRNPLSRLVSCYEDKVLFNNDNNKLAEFYFEGYPFNIKANMPFKEFISVICKIPHFLADRHFKSQAFTLRINNIDTIQIGNVEHMMVDWKIFSEKYHINPHMVHLNKNNRSISKNDIPYYYEYYDLRTCRKIYRKFKKDIHNFGYYNDFLDLITYLNSKEIHNE